MTKSELIKKNGVYMCDNSGVHDAMDEYAKQEAIEFYMFGVTRAFKLEEKEMLTPDEIYQLYLESKNKTQ